MSTFAAFLSTKTNATHLAHPARRSCYVPDSALGWQPAELVSFVEDRDAEADEDATRIVEQTHGCTGQVAKAGYRNVTPPECIPGGLIATPTPVSSASSKADKLTISSRARSCREAGGGALAGLGGFDLPILRWRGRHQLVEQAHRDVGDRIDRPVESVGVGLRRLGAPADLPHVLQRRTAHLVAGCRRVEVVQRADIPAHTDIVETPIVATATVDRAP